MAFTWVRPRDRTVLDGRPLLDVGTGDGQTVAELVQGPGLVVGVDRELTLLRPGNVNAEADALPFGDGTLGTVLAADLFHHLDDERLRVVLTEVRRVLRKGGHLVAWWFESPGREAPDAPRYPRPFEEVAEAARTLFEVDRLDLELTLKPAPPTVGLLARC